jgi:Fic family protein
MELQDLLSKIDELKLEIAKTRPLKPELEQRIMEKFRLDWNYHSNAIEGNKLTLGETKAFLLEGLTADGKPLKDHFDIRGHDAVISFLVGFVQRKEVLTEADIRELHKMLLHEPYQVQAKTPQGGTTSKWVKLGEYKSEPNSVLTPTGALKQFVLPQDAPAKMQELIEWFRSETTKNSTHPIILASIFHHRFTQIHPFDDGNGRMARILMNLILMQNELLPVVIKLADRDKYIAALAKADVGEQNALIVLIAEEEIHSQELFLKGAKGEDIADFDDIDKRILLLKQQLQHKEKPAELTMTIQADFVSRFLSPLVLRLANRMSQFDELFASSKLRFSGKYIATIGPNAHPHNHWSPNESTALADMTGELLSYIKQGNQFSVITIVFQWDGFQRAGLNTFNYWLQIEFAFDKYQYRINAQNMFGHVSFAEKNIYQTLPNGDSVNRLLNDSAETFLKHIEAQIQSKN